MNCSFTKLAVCNNSTQHIDKYKADIIIKNRLERPLILFFLINLADVLTLLINIANVQIYRKNRKILQGDNTIVTPPLRAVEVDNMVVYHTRGNIKVGAEYNKHCLKSSDYKLSNRNHSYTMRYSNVN